MCERKRSNAVRFLAVDVPRAPTTGAVVIRKGRGGAEAAKTVAKMEFGEGACVGSEVEIEGGN